jgi:hypothetical protein
LKRFQSVAFGDHTQDIGKHMGHLSKVGVEVDPLMKLARTDDFRETQT